MEIKIETNWGEATINLKKVKNYYCHVDVWRNEFSVVISYGNAHNGNTDDTLTAKCDSFDSMIRLAKKLHDDLTINYM